MGDKGFQGPPVYVVSGGSGASGELLVRTALAQFRAANMPLHIEPHVHTTEQIAALVERVAAKNGVIVHTLVNPQCRQYIVEAAARHRVWQLDLVGPLLAHLGRTLDQEPVGQPGRYRQLHEAYFNRIEAIEFAIVLRIDGGSSGRLQAAAAVAE